MQQGWTIPSLLSHFFVASSASDGLSTSAATRVPLLLYGLNSKPSFIGILEVPRLLLTVFGVSLRRTLNIN